jgi:hypothetical protein
MRLFTRVVIGFALLPLLPAALAQPPRPSTESVTVTGTKSREVMQDFVKSFAVPTRAAGKLARWTDGICPIVAGVPPGFRKFIGQRVKDVAARVGAPVNGGATCKPNIEIAFTTAPQALMNLIKKKNAVLLGYHDSRKQLDQLATVTHPVQAWYTTATQDIRGNTQVDGGRTAGLGMEITYLCNPPNPEICTMHLPEAHAASVTGTRLGDGLRSGLYHVIIVADPNRLKEYEMGSLADYIAMLALTQASSLDTCQQLPSIVNMLAKDCDRKSDALTENDTAYLRGLYKMSPDMNLGVQQDQVAYQMEKDLTADKAGMSDNK